MRVSGDLPDTAGYTIWQKVTEYCYGSITNMIIHLIGSIDLSEYKSAINFDAATVKFMAKSFRFII
jgi:hypothetical protein